VVAGLDGRAVALEDNYGMSDTPIPLFAAPSRRRRWLPLCCLTVILGVISILIIHARMDGRIDPDDLDAPIFIIIVLLLLTLPGTALACSDCPLVIQHIVEEYLS
jgi:hypothetical protein